MTRMFWLWPNFLKFHFIFDDNSATFMTTCGFNFMPLKDVSLNQECEQGVAIYVY